MNARDPGLQPERTVLSWRRTGWSMLIPGILCLRGWGHTGDVLYMLSSLLLLTGSAAMLCDLARGKYLVISLMVLSVSTLLMLQIVL